MMNFNPNTSEFYALFNYSDKSTGESVAYLNQEYWYTNGFTPLLVVNYTNVIDLESLGATMVNNYYSFDLSKVSQIKDKTWYENFSGIKDGDLVSFSVTAN